MAEYIEREALLNGKIICGFAGIGKSTLAKKRANVVDLESTPFQRDWLTYVRVAKHMKDNGYTVLVSCHNELRTQLHNDGVEYDVVLPNPELKEVFVQRYINRGNTEEFVNLLSEKWTDFCKELPWERAVRIGTEFLGDIVPTIESEPVKWLPVVGYDGLYEVNEYGLIRNPSGKIMKQRLKRAKYTDYKKVSLWKDGKYEHLYVSRIVAEAFIPNPSGLPLVNHKDEDGTNNWVGNLEWCDRSYNAKYGSSAKKLSKAHSGKVLSEEHKQKISDGLKGYYSEHEVWNKGCPNCGAKMHEEE